MVRGGVLLACILVLASAWRGQTPIQASERVAARAGDSVLSMEDLLDLLLERHAFSLDGRDILRHLVQTSMIRHLGAKANIKVKQKEINSLWDRLDKDAKKSGVARGMNAELDRTGMTHEEFRELLRLQILQQILTRRALGLEDDAYVTGEQMALWIDSEIQKRGLQVLQPPWPDGAIAACGEVTLSVDDFAILLSEHLPASEIREAAFHALLLRGIEERMPDLSVEMRASVLDAEVEHRRIEIEGTSSYRGISFEALLGAQGMTVEGLRRDPSVAIAALSALWVDRAYDDEALSDAFKDERSFFEDRFGEALHISVLFLRGAKFKNKWNPRTFEEGEAELAALKKRMKDLASFQELARAISEDPGTSPAGGDLGWITRGDEAIPEGIREEAFTYLGTVEAVPETGALIGPARLENGVVLIWVSERRRSPGWEEMKGYVHQELRRRFLLDVLPQEDVTTFRDR